MDNSKKIRLIQVAKEFKVGFNTLAEFLQRKGLQSDCQPTTPVSSDVYAILEKEFGANRSITGNERDNIRERISLNKQAAVTIEQSKQEEQEEQEVIIKSNGDVIYKENNITNWTGNYAAATNGSTAGSYSNQVYGAELGGATGNGSSLQPYIVIKRWHRTA